MIRHKTSPIKRVKSDGGGASSKPSPSTSPSGETSSSHLVSSPARTNAVEESVGVGASVDRRQRKGGDTLVDGCTQPVSYDADEEVCRVDIDVSISNLNSADRAVTSASKDEWTCTCGHHVSTKNKRCGKCWAWKGGSREEYVTAKKAAGKASSKTGDDCKEGWKCRCGHVSTNKKRCGNCSSWKGGKRSLGTQPALAVKDQELTTDNVAAKASSPISKRKRTEQVIPDLAADVDEIVRPRNAKECARRWNVLLSARAQHQQTVPSSTRGDDPFDCSDLVIPTTSALVEQEVAKAMQKWKDLDSRIIMDDDVSFDEGLVVDGTMGGDLRKQRLLPPNFDYQCRTKPEDDVINLETSGDLQLARYYRPRVISLADPTQSQDYETELWKIFHSMPTAKTLERLHGLHDNSNPDGDEASSHGCQHALRVKNELVTFMQKNKRFDGHSLGRLRLKERHSLPYALPEKQFSGSAAKDNSNINASQALRTTIRFEVLRHSTILKRGSATDANRLEVEMSGSHHTLFDLHRLLAECSAASSTESVGVVQPGVFFIENRLYTVGDVGEDIGKTILHWLDGNQSKEELAIAKKETKKKSAVKLLPRRHFLGISYPNEAMPMSQMRLDDLPLRLGVRYFHMLVRQPNKGRSWSGIFNQSALFITGINTQHLPSAIQAPIIMHDIWTQPIPTTICLACKCAVATVVTISDELTDSSSSLATATFGDSRAADKQATPLCSSCYRALHYRGNEKEGSFYLELRCSDRPPKVLPLVDFQIMASKGAIAIPEKSSFYY